MGKVCIFLANGTEEVEALTVVDIVRRAGIDIDMVSINETVEITSSHNIRICADKIFTEVDFNDYDMIVLPGGIPGTPNLQAHEGVVEQVKKFHEEGKYLAAICAAPSILGAMGILENCEATCYPGYENKLKGATIKDASVAQTGKIITGRALGGAMDFALKIVETFDCQEKANKVKNAIVY